MNYIYFTIILAIAILFLRRFWKTQAWKTPRTAFPVSWRIILSEKVSFYHALNTEEKKQFEFKVQEFLMNCRITGIETAVDDTDRVLVAASAIIPIFAFPQWKYTNLYEVLIYPSQFNDKFETSGNERSILGMVGTGYMEGKMILSKQALHLGFSNARDKKNTAIHEFVHLIDKSDGVVDGMPASLLENQFALPWMELMNRKIGEIYANRSDINPYGATNRAEFFAVASEYFFERPRLLQQKHPELYKILNEVFDQDLHTRKLNRSKHEIGRNTPCPCGSGVKFKKCCGKTA